MSQYNPLLFIPGLASNHALWAHQVENLSDTVDCWVAPMPMYDELRPIAEDILRDAPEKFGLVGSSMGGYLCLEILRMAPERVDRLALIGTTADAELPGTTERRWHMIRKAEQRGFMTMWQEFITRFLHPSLLDDQDLVNSLMKQAFEVGEYSVRQNQIAMMKRSGYLDMLNSIDCPTTVVVGEDDILTPVEDHEKIAKAVPGAQLVVVPNSGHLLSMERPAETTRILGQWLEDKPVKIAA